MNNLNELSKSIYQNNVQKGFWCNREAIPLTMKESSLFSEEQIKAVKDSFKGQLLMLIVSEAAEVLEANRGRTNTLNREEFERVIALYPEDKEHWKQTFEKYIKNSEEDEMADILIRGFDYCGGFNIDIDWHIEQKLAYNKLRSFKHSKNY